MTETREGGMPGQDPGPRSIRRDIAVGTIFLALWIFLPFRDVALLRTINIQDDIYTSDLLNDRLPCRAFVGQSLRRDDLPFWMPGVYTGFPSLAAVEIASLYPSNVFLFTLLPPYVAVAYAQLLPLLIAGLGVFLLVREYGLATEAGLLAAGAFSLSGFLVSHLRQLNMVDAACWIPLLFFAAERTLARRSGRGPLLLAVAWVLQLLAGHPQVSYFTALLLVSYVVVRWRQIDRGKLAASSVWPLRLVRDPLSWKLLAAIVLGTAAAGGQILPSAELSQLSHRHGGFTFEQASMFPASVKNLWTFFIPYFNGDPGLDTYRLSGIFWEQYGYLGLLPILFGLTALLVKLREPLVRTLGAIVLVSYLMVLGRNTPLFFLAYQLVPGMSYFRFPTRFLVFVELGMALLCAFGFATFLDRFRRPALRTAMAAAVLTLTLADLWIHQMRQVPQVSWEDWTSPIGTERFLAAERASGRWRYYSLNAKAVHTATFHEAHGWSGDLGPYVRLRAMLQPSFNLLFDQESPDGYVNLAPHYYEALWGSDKEPGLFHPSGEMRDGEWQLKPPLLTILRLFSVRYLISAGAVAASGTKLATRTPEGAFVYEVSDPMPRAFVVGEVIPADSDEAALQLLQSPSFDPERQAVVHDPSVRLPKEALSSRSVKILERGNLGVVVEVSLERPGLLVLSEGYYPGWRATVDGADTPMVRTNMMMRGVAVPAGHHQVRFEFRSRFVTGGILLSLAGIAGIWFARGSLLSAQNPA